MADVVDLSLARAERATGDCAAWRPRDALAELLAEIDAGKVNPYALVICFVEKTEGGESTGFRNACPSILMAQGVMSRVAWRLNDPEG